MYSLRPFFILHFNICCYRKFSWHGVPLVDALRGFLESFRLPGESPVVERILETLSRHWLVRFLDLHVHVCMHGNTHDGACGKGSSPAYAASILGPKTAKNYVFIWIPR